MTLIRYELWQTTRLGARARFRGPTLGMVKVGRSSMVMVRKIIISIKFFVLLLVLLLVAGLGPWISRMAPDNAIVYVDLSKNCYYAPPCIDDQNEHRLVPATIENAKNLGVEADRDCINAGAYIQMMSPTLFLLSRAGILPMKNRWNEDGSWNW